MTISNYEVAALQLKLNTLGADLEPDGRGGPKTRAAAIETFRNLSAPAATAVDIQRTAEKLGGSLKQLRAVSLVESRGGGWDDTGLLKALYERHYAWRRFKVILPFLSNPTSGGYTTDADNDNINDSWEKVADGACKWGQISFEFASWGKFQIMGAWWKKLGYPSVIDFVWQLSRSEATHYDAVARYIQVNNLTQAFRNLSTDPRTCEAFARGYNGRNYAEKGYHLKLAAKMAS